MAKKRALFTYLTGSYETLNEFDGDLDDSVERICFTDDPTLTSSTWRIVHAPLALPSDPMRSQRVIKITGHPELDPFDETLYIDNSVRLRVNPNLILDSWLEHGDLAIPGHSYRETVADEFDAVRTLELDSLERIDEQRRHYQREKPEVLTQAPYWNALIARRQRVPEVEATMALWMMHVLRYSRRDQLSINFSIAATGVDVNRIALDNHSSPMHEWPVVSGRKSRTEMGWQTSDRALYDRLDQLTIERDELRNHVDVLLASTSWRATAPLRRVSQFFSPARQGSDGSPD